MILQLLVGLSGTRRHINGRCADMWYQQQFFTTMSQWR